MDDCVSNRMVNTGKASRGYAIMCYNGAMRPDGFECVNSPVP